MVTEGTTFDNILTQLTMIKEHTENIPSWASALISICQNMVVEFRLFHGITPRLSKLEKYVDTIENEKDKLEKEADELKIQLDNIEQRNKDFVIMLSHDMTEEQKSYVTTFWPEIGDDLDLSATLDASQFENSFISPIKKHNRVTRAYTQSPRPVIMKFKDCEFSYVDKNASVEEGEIVTIAQPRIMYSEQIEIISFARLVENDSNDSEEFDLT